MSTAHVEAITKNIHDMANAINTRDAKHLGALFEDDAQFVNIVGVWWKSRDMLETAHANHFKGALGGVKVTIKDVTCKFLGADVALCHAPWHRERLADAAENSLPPGDGIFTFVAVRHSDAWKFAACTNVQAAALPVAR